MVTSEWKPRGGHQGKRVGFELNANEGTAPSRATKTTKKKHEKTGRSGNRTHGPRSRWSWVQPSVFGNPNPSCQLALDRSLSLPKKTGFGTWYMGLGLRLELELAMGHMGRLLNWNCDWIQQINFPLT